jgi:hypothetical protein
VVIILGINFYQGTDTPTALLHIFVESLTVSGIVRYEGGLERLQGGTTTTVVTCFVAPRTPSGGTVLLSHFLGVVLAVLFSGKPVRFACGSLSCDALLALRTASPVVSVVIAK